MPLVRSNGFSRNIARVQFVESQVVNSLVHQKNTGEDIIADQMKIRSPFFPIEKLFNDSQYDLWLSQLKSWAYRPGPF